MGTQGYTSNGISQPEGGLPAGDPNQGSGAHPSKPGFIKAVWAVVWKDLSAELRGREMSMIFQNPRAALNPIRRVGHQVDRQLEPEPGGIDLRPMCPQGVPADLQPVAHAVPIQRLQPGQPHRRLHRRQRVERDDPAIHRGPERTVI
mgnify:CR=1 FL=1